MSHSNPVAADQERPKLKAQAYYGKPIPDPYGNYVGEYGTHEAANDDFTSYTMLKSEIQGAIDKGLPLCCVQCGDDITESGYWVSVGRSEVPTCTACKTKDDKINFGPMVGDIEKPQASEMWVSDLAEIVCQPLDSLLNAIEKEYQEVIIEQVELVLDQYR